MSLSLSPICTHRSGAPDNSVERRRLSSQRILSFCSIGTRVGFIFRLSAVVPLNLSRDQNFVAVRPSGKPSGVIAKLACISIPQTRYFFRQSPLFFGPVAVPIKPIFSGDARLKANSVVSCRIRIGPCVACIRMAVALKCPANILSSLTLSFAKNRYAAFVFAQS